MATILVVGDRPMHCDFLATLFGRAGHRVIKAGESVGIRAVMEAARPDLVVADAGMPALDGAGVAQELHNHSAAAQVPIIFYGCSRERPGDHSPGWEWSADPCLPLSPEAMLEAVNAILPLASPEGGEAVKSHPRMDGLLAEARHWSERLSGALELSLALAEERGMERLLERFCLEAGAIMEARVVAVGIAPDESVGACKVAARGLGSEAQARLAAIDVWTGWLGRVAAGRRIVNLATADALADQGGLPVQLLEAGALLVVPLQPVSTSLGWIIFGGRQREGSFDSQDELLARALAVQLAQAWENQILRARLGECFQPLTGNGSGERVAALSRRLVAVQEEERRRLAGVVHDLISPNLAVAKLHLRTLGSQLPPPLRQAMGTRLEDTAALLDDAAACMRDLSADLRPAMLDFGGLFAAVDGYAQLFASRSGIAVEVHGSDPGVRLPGDVESALFRIAQEALYNCAKHARATRVSIELRHDARHAILVVSDDGVGLVPEVLERPGGAGGWGLLTMQERAEFVGGRFRLDSRPGEGTRIAVEI